MAYVQPNSTLQLFKGINLDNRYLHTIYFANATAQDTWFTSKVTSALTFNNLMYRRYGSEAVKIEIDATLLLGVTYMRFKNTRTANKWFYAFVLGVDYVNENTSIVYYEIDAMQTWFISEGSVRPCMVLREHVSDDTIFSHIEAEPVGSEEYEYDYITDANTLSGGEPTASDKIFKEYSVVIATTGKSATGMYSQGLFNGVKHSFVHCNSSAEASNVETELDTYLGSWDAGLQDQDVLSIITFPTYFADRSYTTDLVPVDKSINPVSILKPEYDGQTLSGYVPKNNKLFAYPYSYLYCTTHNGDGAQYKWELFENNATNYITGKTFALAGSFLGGGQIKCYPHDYAGIHNNYECGVSISDFPRNAFNYDAYQAWVANGGKTRLENEGKIVTARGITNITSAGSNFVNTSINSINNISNTARGITNTGRSVSRTGGAKVGEISSNVNDIVQSGASLSNAIINYIEAKNKIDYQWKDAYYRPNEMVGACDPNVMVGGRMLSFYFYNVHVKIEEIKKIDDFFSCYGYAINKVKSPNLTGRKYFNFIQTQGAVIAGNMPSSSKEAIGRIFDGGITFWHNGDNVGNYGHFNQDGTIDNSIASS